MKAQQLRYGNLVRVKDKRNNYFKEYYTIQDIFGLSGLYTLKEVGSNYVKHRYPGIYIEFIPLTFEIAKQCKELKYVNGREKTGCFISGRIRIEIEEGFTIVAIKTANGRFSELVRISSFHELQNVFFYLMGTELTIALSPHVNN